MGFVKDNSSFPHTIRLLLEQLDGAAFYRHSRPDELKPPRLREGPKDMIAMRLIRAASAATVFVCLAAAPLVATAQAPDNSGQNKGQMQTADKQNNAKSDRDITAKIRKEIMADKDLSTYAHNVKIVTANGAVTLKGPVKSEEERAKIAQIAGNTVSADKITNEITVK
ncbi:BON domain-containing protein [Edaphobacter aggregans]|uniref:BON domain-containing protein n=1 Tax=Edaphobacter aggregans TaxID=570835 RepID=UPI001FE22C13|nr:BON domain-containing protein [Edaphobacter aggregans]